MLLHPTNEQFSEAILRIKNIEEQLVKLNEDLLKCESSLKTKVDTKELLKLNSDIVELKNKATKLPVIKELDIISKLISNGVFEVGVPYNIKCAESIETIDTLPVGTIYSNGRELRHKTINGWKTIKYGHNEG